MKRTLQRTLTFLSSRKLSVLLLSAVLGSLVLSTFLPGQTTMLPADWASFGRDHPTARMLSEVLATPRLVRNPLFLSLSFFLFLSTLACTLTRLRNRIRQRRSEFEKDQAFSFTVKRSVRLDPVRAKEGMWGELDRRGWRTGTGGGGSATIGEARKGSTFGFWGSIVFHLGLLICFLAAPVTALTAFRAQFVAPEGVTISLRKGITVHEGKPLDHLPDLMLTLRNLKGAYERGLYNLDFSGVIDTGSARYPIAVNRPAVIDGYDFLFHEFGYSAEVVVATEGRVLLSTLLNLRQGPGGDIFDIPGVPYRLRTVFMPDFFKEDGRIGTRSNDPTNPVLLARFLDGDKEIASGLVGLGASKTIGAFTLSFPRLTHWANLIIVREQGVAVVGVGLLVGVLGLAVRFFCNERILEYAVVPEAVGSRVTLRGYSRYYPAFLEREVRKLADHMEKGETWER